jgi:hypothetical protein
MNNFDFQSQLTNGPIQLDGMTSLNRYGFVSPLPDLISNSENWSQVGFVHRLVSKEFVDVVG